MPIALRLCLWIIAASLLPGCGETAYDDGLIKHQVTGFVTVNGRPLDRVIVRLQSTDRSQSGNAAQPVGVTDAEGKFALSTSGDKDGAVAGEYVMMFLRTAENSESGDDLFHNRFAKPSQSKHKVTIPDHDLEVPPIHLEVPAAWLTAAPSEED
ncbi:hypothetical protein [Blastopirellula marina]|uniref:Carboxypeptidase regulatory-like domain-containing protein n=1 Tax=Blastopirellula marina DSM 3645 TaxID=314230 RepID=A3ZU86_9BACT|nr:hypothetical protein [Blastopirellula marina]EAQ79788.1 hypothetical protein DSM3645_21649 [Blastopirellula marina DSM 3645]